MSAFFKITRRDFLRQAGVGAGALVLGCHISPKTGALLEELLSNDIPLNTFVALQLDGNLIITSFRSEMGQGIRSSLAAVLADELEADWARVKVRQANADGAAYAIGNPFLATVPTAKPTFLITDEGAQFADSSRSMAAYYAPMRAVGAGIRIVFIRAGAQKLGVDPAECKAQMHRVVHTPSGRSLDYGKLLLHLSKVPQPSYPEILAALKKPQDFRFIGTDKMPFVDAKDM